MGEEGLSQCGLQVFFLLPLFPGAGLKGFQQISLFLRQSLSVGQLLVFRLLTELQHPLEFDLFLALTLFRFGFCRRSALFENEFKFPSLGVLDVLLR